MTTKKPIGWVGLGKMGVPMCLNLVKAGFPVATWNRTESKAKEIVDAGGKLAGSISALAAGADVTISMIADDRALESVALGEEGILASAPPGSIYIDMSTVSPDVSARVAAVATTRNIAYLRAPVSGSTALATAGTLTVLASGPKESFDACCDLFEVMGQKHFHVGPDEQARYLKLVLNMMVGTIAATFLPPIVAAINWLFAWLVPVFWLVVFGLFWKRSSGAAILTMVVGWIANSLWSFTSLPAALGMETMPNAYITLVTTFVVGVPLLATMSGQAGYFRSTGQPREGLAH